MKRIRERLTGDVRTSVPFLRNALEEELDTKMFILRNVAKQINSEGGFLQRLIPALRRDSEVGGLRHRRKKKAGDAGTAETSTIPFSALSFSQLDLERCLGRVFGLSFTDGSSVSAISKRR